MHVGQMLRDMPADQVLLHTGPAYPIARRAARLGHIRYFGVDLSARPFVSVQASLTHLPVADQAFDAQISVHVLEHIEDDTAALAELRRTLKPSGWLAVCVPIRLGEPTYEDPTIITPEERYWAYGERTHYRVYGHDLLERLEALGWEVEVFAARDASPADRALFGIRDDEVLLLCRGR
jgi:SAM-dependent methyltransferase